MGPVRWEAIKDDRARFQLLQAPMIGPIVLAGFTYGERAVDVNATFVSVPSSAREQLVSPV